MKYSRGKNPNSLKNLRHGGRPPRNYSIATAMSDIALEPESVDDNGNPLTKAQMLARRIWKVALDQDKPEKVWMDAARLIFSRIEPEIKLTEKSIEDDREPDVDVSALSDERLAKIEEWITESQST